MRFFSNQYLTFPSNKLTSEFTVKFAIISYNTHSFNVISVLSDNEDTGTTEKPIEIKVNYNDNKENI